MSLPGHTVKDLDGSTVCFFCQERPAVVRVQGETDSFGAEYNDLCMECRSSSAIDDHQSRQNQPCDWCGKPGNLVYRRDVDEGMGGPVYRVCGPCVKRDNQKIEEELDYWESQPLGHRLGYW